MGADDVNGKPWQTGNDDNQYRERKGYRTRMPSLLRSDEAHLPWLPSLRPCTGSGNVDLVRTFAVSVFLRPAVNNPSLVDAPFPDRKRLTSLSKFTSIAWSLALTTFLWHVCES
jgi:hypothetical protein